jgi:uncharacterized protein YhbP (UPF0306 family)
MKKSQSQLELIANLLREETTLSLATTGQDGEASATPLFYFADNDLSLYWLSSESSQHSLNLRRTPRVAATVYRNAQSWKEICGVQIRGEASIVAQPERRKALLKAYCERFQLGTVFRMAIRQSTLYLLQPDFFRYIDNARGFGFRFELTRQPEGWTPTQP